MNNLIRNKKVSVLICYYERPSFLPLIVHNLKTQTFIKECSKQVELIIVDDSIPSMCLDITLLRSELKDIVDDIVYLRQETKLTIGQKRNLLCRTAKYGVLIFLDDDDYYFPSYIEYSLMELFKKRRVLVGSNSMLFCYVDHDFKKLSINTVSPRQIHEATMCMLKSHWEITGGFNERGNGEGAKLIDGHENKVNCKLDISKLMVCVCHKQNTCNKEMFLKLGSPAEYPLSEELKMLIYSCTNSSSRVRICFKYATRERPEQFQKTLDTYFQLLSWKHDYHFVISMDSDDVSMNNDHIKEYLNKKRGQVQLEYYYGVSKNKIDAINRDMLAPSFNILVLISDDMIPIVQHYDDIIVQSFEKYCPSFDGMLNFNDGIRKDWPNICTLTIYGYKYYTRFGYIYNPEYESVYCDNEQTDVGRLLGCIYDIDQVIIEHQWNAPAFQDDLRKRTETDEVYERDRNTYTKRKSSGFNLTKKTDNQVVLTMIIVSNRLNGLIEKANEMEALGINVQIHYNKNPKVYSFCYLHRLTYTVTTPYVTFCFINETCSPEYLETVTTECLKSNPDALFFDQKCSFDKGVSGFILSTDLSYENEPIPAQGPWNTMYKHGLINWTIYKSSIWQNIVPVNDESVFISTLKQKLTNTCSLKRVLYSYLV